MSKPKLIDKNKGFTAGEESIVLDACRILERKGIKYIYTSRIDRREYELELKQKLL